MGKKELLVVIVMEMGAELEVRFLDLFVVFGNCEEELSVELSCKGITWGNRKYL